MSVCAMLYIFSCLVGGLKRRIGGMGGKERRCSQMCYNFNQTIHNDMTDRYILRRGVDVDVDGSGQPGRKRRMYIFAHS